jgi:predicted phosphodiesterase
MGGLREADDGSGTTDRYGGIVRIAALYDVHGNLPALEAVLADVAAEGVDEVVVGGDVLWGPLQAECIGRLQSAGASFVAGNCERDVLTTSGVTEDWCASRLDADTRAFVTTWPMTVERSVDGLGTVLFCHATPRSEDEIVTTLTPDDAVREALVGVEANVVVCGHTHVQFDRSVSGSLRLVNAGSVGLPYEGRPGAFWALLGDDVEHRRSEYDVEHALDVLGRAGFPSFADVFPESLRGLVAPQTAAAEFEHRRGS